MSALPPTGRPIRVLLADDDPMARSGIAVLLGTDPGIEVVAQVSDGDEVVTAIHAHHPDVVILDVRMDRQGGIETVTQVKAMSSPPKVLMLTTFNTDDAALRSIEAGADGFLLKTATRELMTEAIRQAAAGTGSAVSAEAATHLFGRVREGRGASILQQEARTLVATLTDRERDVIVAIARGRTNAEIARDLFVSETTVKTHVSSVLSKLGLSSRVQAVVVAYEAGVVRPGEADVNWDS
jgi:DNA-binding NarL/FixJ family response regulator